jgi:Uma2 family endonuclease
MPSAGPPVNIRPVPLTMALQPKPHLSFDDWLAAERESLDERTEYIGGEVFAMAGGTAEHNGIISNINREIGNQFKNRPCHVYASGMKLHIESAGAGKYPDLMALCGEQRFHDDRRDLLLNPSLICEVLSSSTEGYDRGDKFSLYRTVPSLREYLLVAQHRVQVDLYTRDDAGRWILSSFDRPTDEIALPSIHCTLVLADVYDKIEFRAG